MTLPWDESASERPEPGLPRFAAVIVGLAVIASGWLIAAPPHPTTPAGPISGTGTADLDTNVTGGTLFVREGCGACHATVGPSTALGPSLAGATAHAESRIASPDYTGFADTAQSYLREATLDHCADRLPGYDYDCRQLSDVGLRLSDDQVSRLVGFLSALPGSPSE